MKLYLLMGEGVNGYDVIITAATSVEKLTEVVAPILGEPDGMKNDFPRWAAPESMESMSNWEDWMEKGNQLLALNGDGGDGIFDIYIKEIEEAELKDGNYFD